jgi:hypothetical protein
MLRALKILPLLKTKVTTPVRKSQELSAIWQLISMAFRKPFT